MWDSREGIGMNERIETIKRIISQSARMHIHTYSFETGGQFNVHQVPTYICNARVDSLPKDSVDGMKLASQPASDIDGGCRMCT